MGWSEFAQHRTEADVIPPTPCLYCEHKDKIPVEIPLLQAVAKCGCRRRNSTEAARASWGNGEIEYVVDQTSLSWAPRLIATVQLLYDRHVPFPPAIAPPLVGDRGNSGISHRDATIRRRARSGNASYPPISSNCMDNVAPGLKQCAQAYLYGVGGGRDIGNILEYCTTGRPVGPTLWISGDLGKTHPM